MTRVINESSQTTHIRGYYILNKDERLECPSFRHREDFAQAIRDETNNFMPGRVGNHVTVELMQINVDGW